MNRTPGFSLIELIVGLLIMSIFSILLYSVYSQTVRSTKSIQSINDYTLLIPKIYNQIEKDIFALFIPEQIWHELEKKNLPSTEPKKNQSNQNKKSSVDQEEQLKSIVPTDIFYSDTQDKNLNIISFISTHSLVHYTTSVPYLTRIVYTLEPHSDNKNLFRLIRYELADLTKEFKYLGKTNNKKTIDSHYLLSHIKNLSLKFLIPKKSNSEIKPEQKKYQESSTWKIKTENNNIKKLIPEYILFEGSLLDPLSNKEFSINWEFKIPVFDSVAQKLNAKKPSSKKDINQPQSQSQSNNLNKEQLYA